MCIICEAKRKGEAIHREMETELSLAQAQINLDNATAVNKLVEAAELLYGMSEGARADRVLLALDAILPQREERRTGEVNTPDAGITPAAGRDVDGYAEEPVKTDPVYPPQLQTYIDEMRAKGFTIEVVNLTAL